MSDNDNTKLIPLTKGNFAIVDAGDYEWLNQWKWQSVKGYAQRTIHRGMLDGKQLFGCVQMHRLIIDAPNGMQVDHIDGNRSNNTRVNLRLCTARENQRNSAKSINKSSKYKGVTYNKNRGTWHAAISCDHKYYFLGAYKIETEAAAAYNAAAIKYFGEFARINVL